MAAQRAGALAHRGLAWACLLLAFVGWVLILSSVASLQQVGTQLLSEWRGVHGTPGSAAATAATSNRTRMLMLLPAKLPLSLSPLLQACSGGMVTTLSDLARLTQAAGRRLLQVGAAGRSSTAPSSSPSPSSDRARGSSCLRTLRSQHPRGAQISAQLSPTCLPTYLPEGPRRWLPWGGGISGARAVPQVLQVGSPSPHPTPPHPASPQPQLAEV